jgi:hypothetical protein
VTGSVNAPAGGATLSLRRAPLYVRVVIDRESGRVDALDRLGDEPRESEDVDVHWLRPGRSVRADGSRVVRPFRGLRRPGRQLVEVARDPGDFVGCGVADALARQGDVYVADVAELGVSPRLDRRDQRVSASHSSFALTVQSHPGPPRRELLPHVIPFKRLNAR